MKRDANNYCAGQLLLFAGLGLSVILICGHFGVASGSDVGQTEDPLFWIEMMGYWDNDYYDRRKLETTPRLHGPTTSSPTTTPVDYSENERLLRQSLILGVSVGVGSLVLCGGILILLWHYCCVELFKEPIKQKLLTFRSKHPTSSDGSRHGDVEMSRYVVTVPDQGQDSDGQFYGSASADEEAPPSLPTPSTSAKAEGEEVHGAADDREVWASVGQGESSL